MPAWHWRSIFSFIMVFLVPRPMVVPLTAATLRPGRFLVQRLPPLLGDCDAKPVHFDQDLGFTCRTSQIIIHRKFQRKLARGFSIPGLLFGTPPPLGWLLRHYRILPYFLSECNAVCLLLLPKTC